MERGLTVQIELSGPPGGGPILQFSPAGVEVVAATLRPERGKVFNFQAAGLLKVVIIRNAVRTLLSPAVMGEDRQGRQQARCRKRTINSQNRLLLLQMTCN